MHSCATTLHSKRNGTRTTHTRINVHDCFGPKTLHTHTFYHSSFLSALLLIICARSQFRLMHKVHGATHTHTHAPDPPHGTCPCTHTRTTLAATHPLLPLLCKTTLHTHTHLAKKQVCRVLGFFQRTINKAKKGNIIIHTVGCTLQ